MAGWAWCGSAEDLHRALWDLDVAHEYRLHRDADHVGPTVGPRLVDAFAWVAERLAPPAGPPLTAQEQAARRWLDGDRTGPPPALRPDSRLMPELLRALLEPARREAERADPTTRRRYGVLPS